MENITHTSLLVIDGWVYERRSVGKALEKKKVAEDNGGEERRSSLIRRTQVWLRALKGKILKGVREMKTHIR